MVRFSCFFTPNHNQRSKKIQQLGVTMHKKTQDQENGPSDSPSTKTDDNNLSSNNVENITTPSSHEDCWKSEDLNINSDPEDNEEFLMRTRMKKSQSLGCIVDGERDSSGGEATDDDEIDGGFSFNHSHQKSMMRMNSEGLKTSFNIQNEETDLVESFDMISENANHESLFSIEALRQFDQDRHANEDEQSPDHVTESGGLSSDIPPAFGRSQSVNNLRVDSASPTEDTMTHEVMGPQSRSFQNLHLVNGRMAEFPDGDDVIGSGVNLHHEGFDSDNKSTDAYDSHNCNAVANVGRELATDDAKLKKLQQESPIFDKLNPKEFSIRRIQDWISQIDIESDCVVEETGESSASFSIKEPQMESDVPNTKPDAKSHLGMEVASNYMKSLTATSSTAQMANLGLVAVPFLSAFVGLRMLNLSGNAIVRITAGALPRGLHMLNLSKNNIAVIEGLRDLTRLRVLDLSYNRIIRIGHGLASCSSLKELYLAGNKISEVEGLHRLLKLNVLDLRSNKISTAKGLGQLAANYGSLQSVNLDSNPAQRNVGDEQLKKYLLSLLPNLGYYNKQAIRSSGTKEISDRPPRSSALHFDRSTRAEHKLPRRGSHGSGLHKLSLNPVRSKHALGSSSKSPRIRNVEFRHAHIPPIGGSKLSYPLPEADKKPVSLQPSNPIRRVRSEGTL